MDFVSFYGSLRLNTVNADVTQFLIADLFAGRTSGWIKENSSDASKLYSNAEVLKQNKEFGFYTNSVGSSRYSMGFGGARTFGDFVAAEAERGQNIFGLKIIAVSSRYGLIAKCRECRLVDSLVLPTPTGPYQCYRVRFSEMEIEHLANTG